LERSRPIRFGTALPATVVALMAAVAGAKFLIFRASQRKTYSDTDSIPHRHVGLVLGCSKQLQDGRPNRFFQKRIAAATELYLTGKVDYLLVSSDHEAVDMKDALIEFGVPPERIYCDCAGFRTLDSVVRAKEVFGQDAITIISQEFHNRRAIFIAKHSGLDAIGFNASDLRAYDGLKIHLREQLATVVAVMDILVLNRQPKRLGEKEPIPGS
jgi:SanA protein